MTFNFPSNPKDLTCSSKIICSSASMLAVAGLLIVAFLLQQLSCFDRTYLAIRCPNTDIANLLLCSAANNTESPSQNQLYFKSVENSSLKNPRLSDLVLELARQYEAGTQDAKAEALYRVMMARDKKKNDHDIERSTFYTELLELYLRMHKSNEEKQLLLERLKDLQALNLRFTDEDKWNPMESVYTDIAEVEINDDQPELAKEWLLKCKAPDLRILAWCYAALHDFDAAKSCYEKAIAEAVKLNQNSHPKDDWIECEYLRRSEYTQFLQWRGEKSEVDKQISLLHKVDEWYYGNLKKSIYNFGTSKSIPFKPFLDSHFHKTWMGSKTIPPQKKRRNYSSDLIGGLQYLYNEALAREFILKAKIAQTKEKEQLEALEELWCFQTINGRNTKETEQQINQIDLANQSKLINSQNQAIEYSDAVLVPED